MSSQIVSLCDFTKSWIGYTHKRSLDEFMSTKLVKEDQEHCAASSGATVGDRWSSSEFRKTLKSVCYLCEKERDSKGDRTLILNVSTVERQKSIHEKAKEVNNQAVLHKICGFGDQCLDFIANDFRYHLRCMNKFMGECNKAEPRLPDTSMHDEVFQKLLSEVSPGLLFDRHIYLTNQLSSRRDLRSLPPTEDSFRFHVLRSLSQISLYKQATLCNPILLPLEKYGRYVENDRLLPIMKEKPSKPALPQQN